VVIAALRGLRDDIESQNDAGVALRLESARVGRQRWWGERQAADWSNSKKNEIPEAPSVSERLFGNLFAKGKRGK